MNTRDELLAAIEEKPDDDDLRRVYADLLSDEGDPRGELISLQLIDAPNDEQKARIAELWTEHRAEWLGVLDKILDESSHFARGFLSYVRFISWAQMDESIGRDRSFATVRAIDPWWNTHWEPFAFEVLTNPRWHALEEAYRIPLATFDRIIAGEGSCRAKHVSVAGALNIERMCTALSELRGFPRVSTFRVIDLHNRILADVDGSPERLFPLLAAAPRTLDLFGIWSDSSLQLGEWIRGARALPFTKLELGWTTGQVTFTLSRTSLTEPFNEVAVRMPSKWPRVSKLMDIVRMALGNIPPNALERFSVTTSDGGKLAPTSKRQLNETLKRFPRLAH